MLKCFLMRKKLYEYLENNLSARENVRVKNHLQTCAACQNQLNQMNAVLELAKAKKTPQIQEDFWRDFNTGLDKKLNALLVPGFKTMPALRFQFKPLLVYASVSVFVLAAAVSVYFYPRMKIMGNSELALIDEISLLDELTDDPILNGNIEDYLEEIEILDQENPNPA